MKKPLKISVILDWVLFLFTLPWSLFTWGICLLLCLVGLADRRKLRFMGSVLTTEWSPKFAKVYPFTLTLGRSIFFYPNRQDNSTTISHEMVHVRQVEDLMLLSFILGFLVGLCTWNWALGFGLWCSGGLWQLPNFISSILRHSEKALWPKEGSLKERFSQYFSSLFLSVAYKESEHERAAYAQTDVDPGTGKSWLSSQEEA